MDNVFYALVGVDDAVLRIEALSAPPPALSPAKGLRWLPINDDAPTPAAGEVLDGPVVTVGTDKVRRVWTARPAPPPLAVSMAQAKAALSRRGLLAAVEAAVEAAGDEEVKIAWRHASEVRRSSVLVAALAAAAGLDAATVDQLFWEAAAITF